MNLHPIFKRPVCGIFFTVLSACSSTKHLSGEASGHFMATPVVIDGDDKEWPSPYPNYDSKAMISYATANDRDNLYITLKAVDEQIQRKLMMGGLTVWIDPDGKKDEALGIQYPMKNTARMPDDAERMHNRGDDGGRPPMRDSGEQHRPGMPVPNDISFVGFSECSGGTTISKTNSCGIRVRMAKNAYGELVWEASVPLKALYVTATPPANASAISIGFEIGGMAMPARNADGDRHGGGGRMGSGGMGGSSGGMGGMNSGGMGGPGGGMAGRSGGGRRPGEDEDNTNLSQTTKTWTKTGLAFQ